MKTVNKYINYLNEIMQDHWENNKSIYDVDDEEDIDFNNELTKAEMFYNEETNQ